MTSPVPRILRFGRTLREAGLDVHHGRLMDAVRALEWIDLADRAEVRAALRALLVHRHDDFGRFDREFDRFFGTTISQSTTADAGTSIDRHAENERSSTAGSASGGGAMATDEPSGDETAVRVGASSTTAPARHKDFALFSEAELAEARTVLARFRWDVGVRRTRRWQPAGSGAIDLRATLRRRSSHGEIIDLAFRRRRTDPRPVVVIADVSGSMERYSRVLLHFIAGLAGSARRVESFVFATTLTRISPRIPGGVTAERLSQSVRHVRDWGGGTRIGEAIRQFNTRWARRVMRHRPVVLLVSDGWDRGDPETLAREVSRLRRHARRLIWLNPLLGSPGYEPLTRGMQAALPYVDDFLPVHSIRSLEELATHLRR